MSSCRGILIAGTSNTARTQMAEAILRHLSGGRIFIMSGGVHHSNVIHPMTLKVMHQIGIDVSGQSVSTLQSAARQSRTYDVYVSIDAPYGSDKRGADRYQRRLAHHHGGASSVSSSRSSSHSGFEDPLLAGAMPAHWGIGFDTTDARQHWNLWSPRDPSIYHENSTRKFQDHLYEGEPLFMQLHTSMLRRNAKVSERWEMEEVASTFAMERPASQEKRFTAARDVIGGKCTALLRRLEDVYGEELIVADIGK